jgi:hypothetical protein
MQKPKWTHHADYYLFSTLHSEAFFFHFLVSFSSFRLCLSLRSRLAHDIILLQRPGVNDNFLILIYYLCRKKKPLHFEGLRGKPSQPGQCPHSRNELWRLRSFFYLKECAVSLLPDVPHDVDDVSSGVTFWLLSKSYVTSSHRAKVV